MRICGDEPTNKVFRVARRLSQSRLVCCGEASKYMLQVLMRSRGLLRLCEKSVLIRALAGYCNSRQNVFCVAKARKQRDCDQAVRTLVQMVLEAFDIGRTRCMAILSLQQLCGALVCSRASRLWRISQLVSFLERFLALLYYRTVRNRVLWVAPVLGVDTMPLVIMRLLQPDRRKRDSSTNLSCA